MVERGGQLAPTLSAELNVLIVPVVIIHLVLILVKTLRELHFQHVVIAHIPVHEDHRVLHAVARGDVNLRLPIHLSILKFSLRKSTHSDLLPLVGDVGIQLSVAVGATTQGQLTRQSLAFAER